MMCSMANEVPRLKPYMWTIQRGYLAAIPLDHSHWQDVLKIWATLNLAEQEHILYETVHSPLAQKWPPPLSFRRNFLKFLIAKIEEANQEVSSHVYDAYINLRDETTPEQYFFRTHLIDKDIMFTARESNALKFGTTGLVTWCGAKALAEYCIAYSKEIFPVASQDLATTFHKNVSTKLNQSVSPVRVLELGCGNGFLGLAVLKASSHIPSYYMFSDHSAEAIRLLHFNLTINLGESKVRTLNSAISDYARHGAKSMSEGSGSSLELPSTSESEASLPKLHQTRLQAMRNAARRKRPESGLLVGEAHNVQRLQYNGANVDVLHLKWEDIPTVTKLASHVDVILGSDLVFDLEGIPALANCVKILLSSSDSKLSPKVAYFAVTVRNTNTWELFRTTCEELGLELKTISFNFGEIFCYDDARPVIEYVKITLRESQQ